jgi:hypothetical protein
MNVKQLKVLSGVNKLFFCFNYLHTSVEIKKINFGLAGGYPHTIDAQRGEGRGEGVRPEKFSRKNAIKNEKGDPL